MYKITCSVTGKVYVGQTGDPCLRWRAHKNSVRSKTNHPLRNAMIHYGVENFQFEVIEKCPTNDVDEREVYWIAH